jgi:hypothetical protein
MITTTSPALDALALIPTSTTQLIDYTCGDEAAAGQNHPAPKRS